MLKWLFKKLGYVHHSELDHHHCNCCNFKSSWNMVSKYYDNAMLDRLENDALVYGRSMSAANTKDGVNITWTRLSPEKVYKKGAKRGKSKKASSK
jgi:hypothetical protein